jgi:hypothetical protein
MTAVIYSSCNIICSPIQGAQNISNSFGPVAALGGGKSDGAAQMQHFFQNDQLNIFRLRKTSPGVEWRTLTCIQPLHGSSSSTVEALTARRPP